MEQLYGRSGLAINLSLDSAGASRRCAPGASLPCSHPALRTRDTPRHSGDPAGKYPRGWPRRRGAIAVAQYQTRGTRTRSVVARSLIRRSVCTHAPVFTLRSRLHGGRRSPGETDTGRDGRKEPGGRRARGTERGGERSEKGGGQDGQRRV